MNITGYMCMATQEISVRKTVLPLYCADLTQEEVWREINYLRSVAAVGVGHV